MNEFQVFKLSLTFSFLGGLLLFFWKSPLGIGFLLGGLMGSLCFRLIISDATRLLKVKPTGRSAAHFSMRSYIRRYFLYGAALSIGFLNGGISEWSVLVGLLLPKILILALFIKKGRLGRAI